MNKITHKVSNLEALSNLLAESDLSMSDQEALEKSLSLGINPQDYAKRMREFTAQAFLQISRKNLEKAKLVLEQSRSNKVDAVTKIYDIKDVREKLHSIMNRPQLIAVTLAARKESEMSDEDVLSIYADLIELGFEDA